MRIVHGGGGVKIRGAKKTRSKIEDAMGNDAKPGMSKFFWVNVREDARRNDVCKLCTDANAFQGRKPSSGTPGRITT